MDYCPYDSGDSFENENLIQRISNVNSTLGDLKRQLFVEKNLLNQQKMEMRANGWNLPENTYRASTELRPSSPTTESTFILNKAQLKEIESRCDMELDNLNDYIFNINMLRTVWINLRETRKPKSKEADQVESKKNQNVKQKKHFDSISIGKKYPKGKVFYVDSDLYKYQ